MERPLSHISVKAWFGVVIVTLVLGFGALSQAGHPGTASTGIIFVVALFVSLLGWAVLSLYGETTSKSG